MIFWGGMHSKTTKRQIICTIRVYFRAILLFFTIFNNNDEKSEIAHIFSLICIQMQYEQYNILKLTALCKALSSIVRYVFSFYVF